MAGISVVDRELVTIDGNRIKGIAIPDNLPKDSTLCVHDKPESTSLLGIYIVSMVDNIDVINLLNEIEDDKDNIFSTIFFMDKV